jgi:hypothetical protein
MSATRSVHPLRSPVPSLPGPRLVSLVSPGPCGIGVAHSLRSRRGWLDDLEFVASHGWARPGALPCRGQQRWRTVRGTGPPAPWVVRASCCGTGRAPDIRCTAEVRPEPPFHVKHCESRVSFPHTPLGREQYGACGRTDGMGCHGSPPSCVSGEERVGLVAVSWWIAASSGDHGERRSTQRISPRCHARQMRAGCTDVARQLAHPEWMWPLVRGYPSGSINVVPTLIRTAGWNREENGGRRLVRESWLDSADRREREGRQGVPSGGCRTYGVSRETVSRSEASVICDIDPA